MAPFIATAYGPPWGGIEGGGVTSTGLRLSPTVTNTVDHYVVAVDPSVISYGTRLRIWPNPFGDPRIVFTAADTGGAIKGDRIDFYDPRGRQSQNAWGRRAVHVSVLGHGSSTSAPGQTGGGTPSLTAAPSSGSSGGNPLQSHASGALKDLVWVAMAGAGLLLTLLGIRRAAGAGAPS